MATKPKPNYYVQIVDGVIQEYEGFGELKAARAISQTKAQEQAGKASSKAKEYGLIEIVEGGATAVKIFTSGKFCIHQLGGKMGPCSMKNGKMV
jgi:hypothetical protein